jgi:hypothetical protein
VIPKSGNRFSEKITRNQRKTVEFDSTSSNQTLEKATKRALRAWCAENDITLAG